MAKKGKRIVIVLACQDCKKRNYTTQKNKEKLSSRLEIKKYCQACRKHTMHKETR